MDAIKLQLFNDLVNAVNAYKSSALDSEERSGLKANAKAACAAFADYSGITYERATQLVMELF